MDTHGAVVTFGFLILSVTLFAISVIDLRTQRIPDWLSLPLVLVGLVWNFSHGGLPFSDYLVGAFCGFATLAAFGTIYFHFRRQEGLGLGDAKLFAAAGAWLGWQLLPLALLTASLGGLIFAVSSRHFRRHHDDVRIAFGPWISAAIWLLWLAGPHLH